MSETYLVECKESVFRETPLQAADFGGDPRLEFASRDHAETWVAELDRIRPGPGQLTVHAAHPNDKSEVDAYIVFQPDQGVWVPDSDA